MLLKYLHVDSDAVVCNPSNEHRRRPQSFEMELNKKPSQSA